jgi:Rrf2 family nitric oxide-sensitive transcriptional repressor
VRASEGDAPIVECLSGDPRACRITSSCRLKGILVNAFEALYDSLDEHTLADLIERPRELRQALIRS